jgi:N6-L-threonylcarbamoyladenine synthase
MIILGIETSCDETAVGIVTSERHILANRIASQLPLHEPYGGVVPEIAARAHLQQLDRLVTEALTEAQLDWAQIDGFAATCGPGLIGGVMVGAMFGKALAAARAKPFSAVNHLAAHALTARLTHDVQFPYLLLLVSGGHTQLLLVKSVQDFILLGTTRDDAVGECFDKSAKLLGLPYPGGPALEALALQGDAKRYPFSLPLLESDSCDFSFSGLKTAVRNCIIRNTITSAQDVVLLHSRQLNNRLPWLLLAAWPRISPSAMPSAPPQPLSTCRWSHHLSHSVRIMVS